MSLRRSPWREGAFTTFRPKPRRPSKRSADPVSPEAYEAVVRRARGRCEVALEHRCAGRKAWHHRWPVEHGGPSTVANGLYACAFAHGWVHNHPVLSGEFGWLFRRLDPAETPVLVRDIGWRLLTDDGRYEEVAA